MARRGKDQSNDALYEDVPTLTFGRALALDWDGSFWTGDLRMPSLRRFTDGSILVEIPNANGWLPDPIQRGLHWLVEHEAAVGEAIVKAILKARPELTPRTIAKQVDVRTLVVHDIVHGRRPYLGFGFGCTWDKEHGLGLMMHGASVVQLGGADTALLDYIAKNHAKRKTKKSG
jgi:hypothetical protein